MRKDVLAALLVGVVSFTLAACNDSQDGSAPSEPQNVEIEIDFDTKTKTVTAPPPTLPISRPTTISRRPVATITTKPRVTR